MIKNLILITGAGFVLASCDKADEAKNSKDNVDSNPRARRIERPPLESQGTRGRLLASLEAAKRLETPEERDKALTEVGRNALESAPDIVAEAIRELPLGSPEAAELIQACVANLMKRSPDEASAWADSLKDDSLKRQAREEIAVLLVESEPERAIQMLANSNETTGEIGPALEQVLQVWTGRAPKDAAVWASRLPAGESRNAGIKTVVSQWVQTDPAASTSWVKSLSDPKLRQGAVRGMAESLQGLPPFIRDSMLEPADPGIRSEIEGQIQELQPAQEEQLVPEN